MKRSNIVTNLAKNFALQGSDSTDAVVIFDKAVAPAGIGQAARDADTALQDYYSSVCSYRTAAALPLSAELKTAGQRADDAKKTITDKLLYCRKLALTGAADARTAGLIQASIGTIAAAAYTSRDAYAAAATNCTRGICYRPLTPIDVNLSVRGAFSRSDTFLIPDPDTVLFVDPSAAPSPRRNIRSTLPTVC
jgi:hypothetical protein